MGKPTLKTDVVVAASAEQGKILSQPDLDIKEQKVNLFITGIIWWLGNVGSRLLLGVWHTVTEARAGDLRFSHAEVQDSGSTSLSLETRHGMPRSTPNRAPDVVITDSEILASMVFVYVYYRSRSTFLKREREGLAPFVEISEALFSVASLHCGTWNLCWE